MRAVLQSLKAKGFTLRIVTSRTTAEYESEDISNLDIKKFFDIVVLADHVEKPEPSPLPMYKYIELTGADKEEILFIGDSVYDMECAKSSGVGFGLALWGCKNPEIMQANYRFVEPFDIIKTIISHNEKGDIQKDLWAKWAIELQFIAQGGLAYSTDKFDIERFEVVRDIATEIMGKKTGQNFDEVKDWFSTETGYQTPKISTRAAIIKDNKILLVKEENDGRWSLPGGWSDVNISVRENIIKEVK